MSEQTQSEEIAELRECLEVIEYNLEHGLYNKTEQMALADVYLARIAELEAK